MLKTLRSVVAALAIAVFGGACTTDQQDKLDAMIERNPDVVDLEIDSTTRRTVESNGGGVRGFPSVVSYTHFFAAESTNGLEIARGDAVEQLRSTGWRVEESAVVGLFNGRRGDDHVSISIANNPEGEPALLVNLSLAGPL